jgi:SAM-dependent methyltransferase
MEYGGSAAPEALRAAYDHSSATYDEKRLKTPFQRRFDASERAVLRHHFRGLPRVLEVGAGTGRLTGELLGLVQHVIAVDISPGMLEKLQRKYAGHTALDVRILNVFDLEDLPGYGTFDGLLSMRMLPHIQEMERALGLFYGAVRPGGTAMFDFWNRNSYVHWRKRGMKAYTRCVTAAEARAMIASVGWELVSFYGAGFDAPVNLPLEFLGRTPLWRFGWSLIAVCRRAR